MKKKTNYRTRIRQTRKPGRSTGRAAFKVAPILIFTFCLLGCLWVWKENWNEKLSTKLLNLEKTNRDLKEQRDILRAGLADLSQFARIEYLARKQLGMVTPRIPPDTVWCESMEQKPMLGAMIFYGLDNKGK